MGSKKDFVILRKTCMVFFLFMSMLQWQKLYRCDQVKYHALKYKKLEVHLKLKTKCVGHEKDR